MRPPSEPERPPGPGSPTGSHRPPYGGGTGGDPRSAGGGHHARGPESGDESGPRPADDATTGTSTPPAKRKGSFVRELPLLILVAVVLTFVIQTFVARIYVIPSSSMEKTLHGCDGCEEDRVAVDKLSYRFTDPAPGDVVVFRGPAAWRENDEVSSSEPSPNPLIRGWNDVLSTVGLAPPTEKDFVKRVVATGGQTVSCCDTAGRASVDGKPLNEPYVYIQPGTQPTQMPFGPVQVPPGQLWVMGDNRNNSADARFHGPIGTGDVIGKARVIVLPASRWNTVPAQDPQQRATALGAPGWAGVAPGAVGTALAVPVVGLRRRTRRDPAWSRWAPPRSREGP